METTNPKHANDEYSHLANAAITIILMSVPHVGDNDSSYINLR